VDVHHADATAADRDLAPRGRLARQQAGALSHHVHTRRRAGDGLEKVSSIRHFALSPWLESLRGYPQQLEQVAPEDRYHLIGVRNNLDRRGVFGQTFSFNTGEDESADDGIIPSHVCLQPVLNGHLAAINPACRALLTDFRNQLQPGAGAQFINVEPWLDGDRKMGYLWGYSLGVKRELMPNLAASIDYVGNRSRNQTGQIDISESAPGADGRIRRLTADEFDPDGSLIPASARDANFLRVLQYQTRDDLNTDFDSLELSLEQRYSDRWSGRISYTLAYSNDVGNRFTNDLNPRDDDGRSSFDNRNAFVANGNYDLWGGIGVGAIVRYYSGYPINETVGSDLNGDRDNNERPVSGVHDLTLPILSELDANGRAVKNGIQGNSSTLLDLRMQYISTLPGNQTVGLFWEVFNALNKENLGNPTGNRNNRNYMIPVEAGTMRSMQLGVRYTF
jgi:hypothetical protein